MVDVRAWLELERDRSGAKTSFWATLEEARILVSCIERSGADIFAESGTCNGYTSTWAATTQVRKVHTFDPADRPKIWTGLPVEDKILFYHKKFEEGLADIVSSSMGPFKIYFFVDGDHSRNGIASDFNALLSIVKPGDRIMFHDSGTEYAVAKFMGRIHRRFPEWKRQDFETARGMTEFEVV